MAYTASVISVMIASPGDVLEERDEIRRVLHDLNDLNARSQGIVLLPVGWDTHSAPLLSGRAQDIINKSVLDHCDILVGVFWTRLGTPTGNEMSGTVEEIKRHVEAGKPTMVYFSEKLVAPPQLDPKQYGAVQEFKEWCKNAGIIWVYDSLDQFRDIFRRQIQLVVRDSNFLPLFSVGGSAVQNLEVPTGDALMMNISEAGWELLSEASKGYGSILRLPALSGTHISANGVDFTAAGDARRIARYEAGLEQLENFGLITSTGGKREVFKVTDAGYQFADSYSAS